MVRLLRGVRALRRLPRLLPLHHGRRAAQGSPLAHTRKRENPTTDLIWETRYRITNLAWDVRYRITNLIWEARHIDWKSLIRR